MDIREVNYFQYFFQILKIIDHVSITNIWLHTGVIFTMKIMFHLILPHARMTLIRMTDGSEYPMYHSIYIRRLFKWISGQKNVQKPDRFHIINVITSDISLSLFMILNFATNFRNFFEINLFYCEFNIDIKFIRKLQYTNSTYSCFNSLNIYKSI